MYSTLTFTQLLTLNREMIGLSFSCHNFSECQLILSHVFIHLTNIKYLCRALNHGRQDGHKLEDYDTATFTALMFQNIKKKIFIQNIPLSFFCFKTSTISPTEVYFSRSDLQLWTLKNTLQGPVHKMPLMEEKLPAHLPSSFLGVRAVYLGPQFFSPQEETRNDMVLKLFLVLPLESRCSNFKHEP